MRPSAIVVILIAIVLAMPLDAFARAGKGGGFGSRGSRTFDRPIERSITPQPAPGAQQPMVNPNALGQRQMAPSAAMGASRPGFFQRNPMMGGLMAGFLGAGLFGLLFNSSAFAGMGAAAPMASVLGMVFQLALIGGLVWLALRLFRRNARPAPAGTGYARQAHGPSGALSGTAAGARVEKQFEPTPEDKDAFTAIIAGVQAAWTAGDVGRLRALATPEVVSWLAEDLSRDASRGVRNVVEDVELLKGDVTESWHDGERDFATAVVTFSARDYSVDGEGRVVEGDPDTPVEATEAWTFVRAAGGKWLLSAIEQT